MKNAINWFEIPTKNFERAVEFYSTILGAEIAVVPHPMLKYAVFPRDKENGAAGGSLAQGPGYEPSDKGALVYLNSGDDLSIPLSRVEEAGGKIVLAKTSIGPNGFMAHIIDTEGNKVGLHSMK